MKRVISLVIAAYLVCGCAAGSGMTHEDSAAGVNRDEGPALCRDGTTPPCNARD
jgi:hypothetical protein